MPIVEGLDQGTEAWHAFRKNKIGASMSAAVCGRNEYETTYQAWARCVGVLPPVEENHAMREGKRIEPEALAAFNESHGFNMKPAVYQSQEYPFLFASLDGIEGDHLVEIKCSKKLLETKECPTNYKYQIQQQLFVSGCSMAYYFTYYNGEHNCEKIFPDMEIRKEIITKGKDFFRRICEHDAPEMTDKDYIQNDSQELKTLLNALNGVREEIKACKEQEEFYRDKIVKLCGNKPTICGGAKITKYPIPGRVDYATIPELKNVNLDLYRKPSSEGWRITVE